MLLVCLGTAAWAGLSAVQPWWAPGLAHASDGIRAWLWLDLLVLVLAGTRQFGPSLRRLQGLIAVLAGATVVIDLQYASSIASPVDYYLVQCYARIAISIGGLLLVENVYRNGAVGARWNIAPLCVAAGALFGFDFYVFGDAVVQRSVDASLLATRGIILALVAPLIFLTLVRNQDWRIYVHVSRGIVFHTATLIIGGLFLLGAGAAASLLGMIAGPWGDVFRFSFVVAILLAALVIISMGRFRSQLFRFVNENFFSSRYDYRLEWMRFVETLTSGGNATLQERVIHAIANVVDSPAGVLWLEDFDGAMRVVRSQNMAVAPGASEAADGSFLAAFRGGEAIQQFAALPANESPAIPGWVLPGHPIWLAVPLVLRERITGFIVLAPPRAQQNLNWESFDLLRILGRQIAGYLAEEKAMSALVEARALIEYSKNFSFIAHDIKNVAGQLTMLAANASRFGNDERFQADMIKTLQHAATKLKNLLDGSKPSATPATSDEIDPVPVVKSVIEALSREGRTILMDINVGFQPVRIDAGQLDSALVHLITNALEASAPDAPVIVQVSCDTNTLAITVKDRGTGMDAVFVRERLFMPRHSTKEGGHGIGAYQARELIRRAGGDLKVASEPGKGTTVQIVLPLARAPQRELALAR
jgi:putative PEP-CTERM system histidine kinase